MTVLASFSQPRRDDNASATETDETPTVVCGCSQLNPRLAFGAVEIASLMRLGKKIA